MVGLSQFLHQFFQHEITCGAEGGILQRERLPFDEYILVSIRKPLAIRGSLVVDGAEIISAQERAGGGPGDEIAFLIHTKVGLDELALLHPEVFGNPLHIWGLEAGRVALAAVCALQAINPGESFLMKGRERPEYAVAIGALEKTPVQFLPLGALLFPILKVIG